MRHPWLFALVCAFLCPFYAFGFPSVSPFWGASNLDWLNKLRSDYPLISTCVELWYFRPGPCTSAICALLPSCRPASLNRCSRRSPVLADERCASFYVSVQTLGPCAAYSRAYWRTTLIVRSELFVEQDSCSAFRRARVCCPIDPLSFAPSRASQSGRQFLVMHGDLVRGVADQYHKPCAERADSPCLEAWSCVHSVANSERTERSRTCFKAEEQ
jgi:hypothetical protein